MKNDEVGGQFVILNSNFEIRTSPASIVLYAVLALLVTPLVGIPQMPRDGKRRQACGVIVMEVSEMVGARGQENEEFRSSNFE